MVADDANITTSAEILDELKFLVNKDLDCIFWFLANKLTLNSTKIEFIIIGTDNRIENNTEPADKIWKSSIIPGKSVITIRPFIELNGNIDN